MKKHIHSCIETLIKNRILHEVKNDMGLFYLDGLEIVNKTGKTAYILVMDEKEVMDEEVD